MIVITILLFIVLLLLMYLIYCIITDTIPFWQQPSSILDFSSSSSTQQPVPDTTALGYCTFKGDDLASNIVFGYNGTKVPATASPLPCSQCNQYIFKDSTGCMPYTCDRSQNTTIDDTSSLNLFCDPAHPERANNCIKPHGKCTVDLGNVSIQNCPF